jgi:hypothetical protein
MAFPAGWPPTPDAAITSLRFYATATSTANWSDNVFRWFSWRYPANPQTCQGIRLCNDGAVDLEASFAATADNDNTHIAGRVKQGEVVTWLGRRELGIAIRNAGGVGGGSIFRVEVW